MGEKSWNQYVHCPQCAALCVQLHACLGYLAPHAAAPLLPLPAACCQMRDTYGKLVYLLMDSCEPEIQELLEFK